MHSKDVNRIDEVRMMMYEILVDNSIVKRPYYNKYWSQPLFYKNQTTLLKIKSKIVLNLSHKKVLSFEMTKDRLKLLKYFIKNHIMDCDTDQNCKNFIINIVSRVFDNVKNYAPVHSTYVYDHEIVALLGVRISNLTTMNNFSFSLTINDHAFPYESLSNYILDHQYCMKIQKEIAKNNLRKNYFTLYIDFTFIPLETETKNEIKITLIKDEDKFYEIKIIFYYMKLKSSNEFKKMIRDFTSSGTLLFIYKDGKTESILITPEVHGYDNIIFHSNMHFDYEVDAQIFYAGKYTKITIL
jgi:hypothetical protein